MAGNLKIAPWRYGASQNLAIGAASAQSAAVGPQTYAVQLSATTNCHVAVSGPNPVALATGPLIKASDPPIVVRIDSLGKIAVIQDGAPTQSAPSTSTTGGTLAAATYFYKISAITAQGETPASNEQSQVTTGTTSTVTLTWTAVPGANSYRIYRGTAANGENVFYTVAGNLLTFTDTGAANTGGTPVVNAGTLNIVEMSH